MFLSMVRCRLCTFSWYSAAKADIIVAHVVHAAPLLLTSRSVDGAPLDVNLDAVLHCTTTYQNCEPAPVRHGVPFVICQDIAEAAWRRTPEPGTGRSCKSVVQNLSELLCRREGDADVEEEM